MVAVICSLLNLHLSNERLGGYLTETIAYLNQCLAQQIAPNAECVDRYFRVAGVCLQEVQHLPCHYLLSGETC